jgi:transcriptional regulator with XRE-family HTH domain
MKQKETKPLAVVIGESIREWREASGKRQDDIAAVARKWGLRWTRATVAAIELGRRQLTVGEFLLLPCVLGFGHIDVKGTKGEFPELFHLLPEEGLISVTPETSVSSKALREILLGKAGEGWLGNFNTPELRNIHSRWTTTQEDNRRYLHEMKKVLDHVWPAANHNRKIMETVRENTAGDAEMKAAKKLSVPPLAVALAAHKLWDHSLTAERDRQVSEQTTDKTPPRTLQAIRGHVTRTLLTELQPLVAGLSE